MKTVTFRAAWCLALSLFCAWPSLAQETDPPLVADSAEVTTKVTEEGTSLIVEATGVRPKVPTLYAGRSWAVARVEREKIAYWNSLVVHVEQGKAKEFRFKLVGDGEITKVEGAYGAVWEMKVPGTAKTGSDEARTTLKSWSVQQVGEERFLVLVPGEQVETYSFIVEGVLDELKLPRTVEILRLEAGDAMTQDLQVRVLSDPLVRAQASEVLGYSVVEVPEKNEQRFVRVQEWGRLKFAFSSSDGVRPPAELQGAKMVGEVNRLGGYVDLTLTGEVVVHEEDGELEVLRGHAAMESLPSANGYQLILAETAAGSPSYRLKFAKKGTYPVSLKFTARLREKAEWTAFEFQLNAGAMVPLTLRGLEEATEFHKAASIVPLHDGDAWVGYVPLSGNCAVAWKAKRKAGEGKLFFNSEAVVNVGVGSGLLRQSTEIGYKILQGKLERLTLAIDGPGEILAVEGQNVLNWKVLDTEGATRILEVALSRPIESSSRLRVRSQLALDAFPVQVAPLRITPDGAVRHSGYVRVYNIGATRLEVVGAEGLTQLAPEQFPGEGREAGDRQNFVYRFPVAVHAYEVVANRVQPEVSVSQTLLYQLSETDRIIEANVELDIREAPLREWDFILPADYSVVTVLGAEVGDYVVGSQIEAGERTLKVIFNKEVGGRQLVRVQLEKNEAAESGAWVLPKLRYPEAKAVRGQVGVASGPGFRVAAGEVSQLAEIALSRFPENRPGLQQAFRIRDREWSGTMTIEKLAQSVQADVFHLYSLKDQRAYASVVVNYFITGAPVSEFTLTLPENADHVEVDGQDIGPERREGNTLRVPLHQPVIGSYLLLVTYEEPLGADGGEIRPGQVSAVDVRGERGFIQVVSPLQVNATVTKASKGLLKLDPMELPAEFRLFDAAPALATYQYTARPFEFAMKVGWFDPGETIAQVVEFSEAESKVSRDGEVRTEVSYLVKSRGARVLRVALPAGAKLWEVLVAGERVSARIDGEQTLIPLPAEVNANGLVEVKLRLAKPAESAEHAVVTLPKVEAPVLKTKWVVSGEAGRLLVPKTGGMPLKRSVLTETGFEWVSSYALVATAMVGLLLAFALWLRRSTNGAGWQGWIAIFVLLVTVMLSLSLARKAREEVRENLYQLDYSVPVLAAGDQLTLVVGNYEAWQARLSVKGVVVGVIGLVLLVGSLRVAKARTAVRVAGAVLIACGVLMQRGGATWFYFLLALAVLALLLPWLVRSWKDFDAERRKQLAAQAEERRLQAEADAAKQEKEEGDSDSGGSLPGAATTLLVGALLFGMMGGASLRAEEVAAPTPVLAAGFAAADEIVQSWTISEGRLSAQGELKVTGEVGDSFVLLRAPGVLTTPPAGKGLRLSTRTVAGLGQVYVVTIKGLANEELGTIAAGPRTYQTGFRYELQVPEVLSALEVLTGPASVQKVSVVYDQSGWDFDSSAAMKVADLPALGADQSGASLVLAPRANAVISLRPKMRDVSAEETQFYAEVQNLYLPSPGVVDGRHYVQVRPSQGEVRELTMIIPEGFTVGEVGSGPVGEWQFDAEARTLTLAVVPAQTGAFGVLIETQSGLGSLPTDVTLAPLVVKEAAGEVGMVALAFGDEAQPEKTVAEGLSAVNLSDFSASLVPERQGKRAVLHRVYRYGKEGGKLTLRVAPVAPEVRVVTSQVLSMGDERLVLSAKITAAITRAGIFQLSFPLPAGLEVESLTGSAMSHWSELEEEGTRIVVMQLSGKTLGSHEFNLALTGPAPTTGSESWSMPRVSLREAKRQTGELVVKPTTGILLRTVSRKNVSELDPRKVGGQGEGALAYRLLQSEWDLKLGVDKQDPWVTGDVLQEVTLREGQTQTSVAANLKIENASIRSLRVQLPGLTENETKTVRFSGTAVGDASMVEGELDVWEVRLKRRMIGAMQLRIEHERTGEQADDLERVQLVKLLGVRQALFVVVRAGARLELSTGTLPKGYQAIDWNAVPQKLREAGDRSIPAMVYRAVEPEVPLSLRVRRHSVAEALKLRVAAGEFLTVVSPIGEILTMVDMEVDVIQRSTLRVELPESGMLYHVLVNGESVGVVREGQVYQFYVLPSPDERSATVEFAYSLPGTGLVNLELNTPQMNVPLENIQWSVIVPEDYQLAKHEGDLDFTSSGTLAPVTKEAFLLAYQQQNAERREVADAAVVKFNDYISRGEQKKANVILHSVFNNQSLDAATNEDVRVQLNELERQQVAVGLATRQQRVYRDNWKGDDGFAGNKQLEEAAFGNEIINSGLVNFRPQEVEQFMGGNSREEKEVLNRLAARLVGHKRTTESAPQAISLTKIEEGRVFQFSRSVQVKEGEPLKLQLRFDRPQEGGPGRVILALLLVVGIASALVMGLKQRAI